MKTFKTLVVTHRKDFDGFCSQAIARRALGDKAKYLGWDYGDEVPDIEPYQTVYLIDISFPKEVMIKYAEKLIWIDHHISKMRELEGVKIRGYRIDGVAACRLAWQYFEGMDYDASAPYPEKQAYIDRTVNEPYAVQLLGEYDIWDKRNPDVDSFQLGITALSDINWDRLFNNELYTATNHGQKNLVANIIADGEIINQYVAKTNRDIAEMTAFDVKWEGLNLLALNTAKGSSLLFEGSIKPHHDGCLAYRWNGKLWLASLYGVPNKDIDMTLIAKKYGGGGHKKAAGMTWNKLPVELGGS